MIRLDGIPDDDDPLAPNNPLAIPLVDTLHALVETKQALAAACEEVDAYQLLAKLAMQDAGARTKELATARRTIEHLRTEIRTLNTEKAA